MEPFLIVAIALVALVALRPLGVLAANREVDRYVDQELRQYQVKASAHIYKGAFVGLDAATGYVRPLEAGDVFMGIAYEEADNSSGADGAKKLRVFTLGDFELTLTGAALTDIGASVYASADDTLTLTATSNSLVGKMVDLTAANTIILRMEAIGTGA